jgi:hypothetical protein
LLIRCLSYGKYHLQNEYKLGQRLLRRKGTIYFCIIASVLFFIFGSIPAFAGSATLSWNPPTTNTDGTHLTDLAGFKIYYGTSSGNYTQVVNAGYVTTYTVNNLNSGTYYFVATAYDTSGNESGYSNQVSKTIQSGWTSQQYSLAVTKGGTGSGTVTSSPSGISCGYTCSAPYNSGSVVILSVSPASGSVFNSWSGACVGNGGQCTLLMNANTAVKANFAPSYSQLACSGPPVRIARSAQYYSTIQTAYNAARDGDVIQIQAVNVTGDVDINRNIDVIIEGGYDCNFSAYVQNSVINGTLILDGGSFVADGIVIQ